MATLINEFTEILPPGMFGYRLTTVATTDTFRIPLDDIVVAIAKNESDDDGVGVKVDGQVVTLTVGTVGDVVALKVVGRK